MSLILVDYSISHTNRCRCRFFVVVVCVVFVVVVVNNELLSSHVSVVSHWAWAVYTNFESFHVNGTHTNTGARNIGGAGVYVSTILCAYAAMSITCGGRPPRQRMTCQMCAVHVVQCFKVYLRV